MVKADEGRQRGKERQMEVDGNGTRSRRGMENGNGWDTKGKWKYRAVKTNKEGKRRKGSQ